MLFAYALITMSVGIVYLFISARLHGEELLLVAHASSGASSIALGPITPDPGPCAGSRLQVPDAGKAGAVGKHGDRRRSKLMLIGVRACRCSAAQLPTP